MPQIETIVSTVRPIKKLSIIDNDPPLFFKIIQNYTEELGGFYNLILLNDESLFSENTINFVNEHDPDLIINYSKCENIQLEKIFKTKVLDGKNPNFRYISIATPLGIFDNIPDNILSFFNEIKEIEVNFTISDDAVHHFLALNFGILGEKFQTDWEENDFFKTRTIKQINPGIGNLHLFDPLLKYGNTLVKISNALSRVSISTSVYTKNNNKENYFHSDPTLIIGSNKISNYVYFWNIRATYPFSTNIWLPIEMFDDFFQTYCLKDFKYYCLLDKEKSDEIRSIIKAKNCLCSEIDGTRYYFHTIENGWKSFDFIQNCINDSGKVRIIHPQTKLFSKVGYNVNLAIEIRGLGESYLPKSLKLGKLFDQRPEFEPQHFTRMSSRGLISYFSEFSYLDDSSLLAEITIPRPDEIFRTLFNERDIVIKETKNTQVINQVISLFNSPENIDLLTDPLIFELVVKFSPKRIERLVKEIMKEINFDLDDDEIRHLLIKNMDKVTTIYSQMFIQVSQIESKLGIHIKKSEIFYEKIQKLYDLNILLRGKKIICPLCNQILWYPLSKLDDHISCYCCNTSLSMPICDINKVEEDSLKLNELLINATDQGVLPVLLTLNVLNRQRFGGKKFIFDYELFDDKETLIGEIDIIFNFGRKIGLAEVKADRGFDEKQVLNLLKISEKIHVDLLVFSTLKDKNSDEVRSLVEILNQNHLTVPAFILTNEVLFKQISCDFTKYFEIRYDDNFPKGPIVI